MTRRLYTRATADLTHAVNGVAVVGSYQTAPPTDSPFKVHALLRTAKTERYIEVALTRLEARKLVEDWVSMGLFGRHGRIETKAT